MKTVLKLTTTVLIALLASLATAQDRQEGTAENARGKEILARFIEINRYWLISPPATVRQFSYMLNRIGATQEFAVPDPQKATRARRTGVTYSTMLHQIASKPESVTVRSITEEDGRIRLILAFDPPVRGACGNGVENSWNGYFNLGSDTGYLLLDAKLLVPIEAGMDKFTETFAEFVAVDSSHFVPLAITIQKENMRFDWRFRLYEPGLWLFDDCRYGERRVAWVEQVKVNEETPVLRRAVAESLAREKAKSAGTLALRTFLNANQHWLLPALQARRGLIYEYRQETPYLERVLFDPDGNVMVELASSKEAPGKPTRSKLWLADGRRINSDFGDRYVAVEAALTDLRLKSPPYSVLLLDRQVQNLAMGLGWECALTRLAREPEAFWIETLAADTPDQYRLVAHAWKDAQLFAGTILAFTSWAYMHDVRFDRSEILCDAATHRPIVERDFAGKDELKGEFFFEEWVNDSSGAAPGRIRTVIPYQKDGKDQSLEMNARFHFVKTGVWLLEHVESHFRGGMGGSTGTVSVVSTQSDSFAPMAKMIAKMKVTEQTVAAIKSAPEGTVEVRYPSNDWTPCELKTTWTEEARKSVDVDRSKPQMEPLIGIHRVQLERTADGPMQISFDGVSTAIWKEFETEWKIGWHDGSGHLLGTVTTNVTIRAENTPAPFVVSVAVPSFPAGAAPTRISVEGKVQRITGAYHGHGIWMRFMKLQETRGNPDNRD